MKERKKEKNWTELNLGHQVLWKKERIMETYEITFTIIPFR